MKRVSWGLMFLLLLVVPVCGAWAFDRLVPDWMVTEVRMPAEGSYPDVAAEGDNSLIVVWQDKRSGDLDLDVYARRYSSAGDPLGDEFRVDQAPAGKTAERPGVAVGPNGNFIVVWGDWRSNPYIYARRYGADGLPLGSEFLVSSLGSAMTSCPDVAVDRNNNFIVAWQDASSSRDHIYARRYDSAGNPLGSEFQVDQSSSDYSRAFPAVAADGNNNFIITWQDSRSSGNRRIYARRYNSSGAPLGSESLVDQSAGTAAGPDLTTDPANNFIIAWSDSRYPLSGIYARRFKANGTALGNEFKVDQATATAGGVPSITADAAGNFTIAWRDSRAGSGDLDIYARRFDGSGSALGNDFRVDQTAGTVSSEFPALSASPDNNLAVVWQDNRTGVYQVTARRLNSDGGARGDEFKVNQGTKPGSVGDRAVESDHHKDFIVAWADNRAGVSNIYARRYDEHGAGKGAEFRLDQGTSGSMPALAVESDNRYLVVWLDYRGGGQIYARLMGSDDVALGNDFQVSNNVSSQITDVDVAVDGADRFMVTWVSRPITVMARILDGNAQPLGNEFPASDYSLYSIPEAKIAANGNNNFMVTWIAGDDGNFIYGLYARCFDDAGNPLGSGFAVGSLGPWVNSPAVTSDGNNHFIIVWADNPAGNYDIYGRGLGGGGVIRIDQAPGTFASGGPAIAADGNHEAVIAWSDNRAGNSDVYARRYAGNGVPLGNDFRVDQSAGTISSVGPALAANGNNHVLFTWVESNILKAALWGADADHDAVADLWDNCPAVSNPDQADADHDLLGDACEALYGADPLNPDTDADGVDDGDEVHRYGTQPGNWDSDGDRLPDGFEIANLAHGGGSLNPLNAFDAAADFDGDGNSNANEYWNGSDPWSVDPTPGQYEDPGCYYWGDGDGDGIPAPSDVVKLRLEIAGVMQAYRDILPHGIDTLDLDRDGFAAPSDQVLLALMVAGSERPGGYPSQAAALEVVAAPSGSVAAGSTTHVTVSVHSVSGILPFAPGYGVVFEVVSGNAVLLGGDGTADGEPAGNRYDFSMEAAAGARANMVVLVTGSGPITIGAKVPGCGTFPYGRWNDEVVLSPGVVINP